MYAGKYSRKCVHILPKPAAYGSLPYLPSIHVFISDNAAAL